MGRADTLVFAVAYNTIGIPIAAGVLYPAFGLLLGPIVAALAMSLSSVSVIANALRLRTQDESDLALARLVILAESGTRLDRRPACTG
jgi:hypothetical protein